MNIRRKTSKEKITMRHLICIILSLQTSIFFLISCSTLNKDKNEKHKVRGIELWDYDPRLFCYEDSDILNKHYIDSILGIIYDRYSYFNDTDSIPIGNLSKFPFRFGDTYIINLANAFVKNDEQIKIPCNSYTPYPEGHIIKNDLLRLRRIFTDIHIEAKDIIDIINLGKQDCGFLMFQFCFKNYFEFTDIAEIEDEFFWHEYRKITQKYKSGIIKESSCIEQYSVLNDTNLTTEEKIDRLTRMIGTLIENCREYDSEFDGSDDIRIKRWRQEIDSLETLLSISYRINKYK